MNKRRNVAVILATAALLTVSFCAAAQDPDSLAFVSADWHWQDLGKGAQAGYASISMFDSVQSIAVVRYPARRYHTTLISATGKDAAPTDSLAIRADARFALNGSYFNMRTLEPATFFVKGKEMLGTTYNNGKNSSDGLLAINRKNGKKMDVLYYDGELEEYYRKHYYAALASGPVLRKDGKTADFNLGSSFVTARHPRSFIGLTDDGYVYIIVVDGRFPGKAAGASIVEIARMAEWFGLTDAINFDGGGSSAVWTDETGIINHPSDNRKFDHNGARRVPNIIAVR